MQNVSAVFDDILLRSLANMAKLLLINCFLVITLTQQTFIKG